MHQSKKETSKIEPNKVLTARFAGLKSKESPKYNRCIFLISIGKDNFEGSALEAQLKLINSEFKHCHILIADTLQRYNFLASASEILSNEKALAIGSQWLEKNSEKFKRGFSNIQYSSSRWNSWIENPKFDIKKKIVEYELENTPSYLEAMNKSVTEFVNRCRKRVRAGELFSEEAVTQSCKEYLKEECAVFLLLVEDGVLASIEGDVASLREEEICIVYPGKETPILAATIELINKRRKLLSWQTLRLEKKTQLTEANKSIIFRQPSLLDDKCALDLNSLASQFESQFDSILLKMPNLTEKKEFLEKMQSYISNKLQGLEPSKSLS